MSLHKYVRRRNPAAREYLEIFLIQLFTFGNDIHIIDSHLVIIFLVIDIKDILILQLVVVIVDFISYLFLIHGYDVVSVFILWKLSVICESGNLPDSVKKELP